MGPGTLIYGKYEVIKLLGEGGMSKVYQARSKIDGRLLAIKIVEKLGQQDNRQVVRSLSAEAQLLKKLNNPHLPRIYDVIDDRRGFILVMDYIKGLSLDVVLNNRGAQPLELIYSIGMQICDVFTYLHNQRPAIIYRDMKPANVILQPDGHVMMIDFGTARTYKDDDRAQDTVCIGTEGFAAPEQFGGRGESDARTDIFCLGATLYNLATGHSPYIPPRGILPMERMKPELAGTPISFIIEKCCRIDPKDRYQTAEELRRDLYAASIGNFRGGVSAKTGRIWVKQSQDAPQPQMPKPGISKGLTGIFNKPKYENVISGELKQPSADLTGKASTGVFGTGMLTNAAETQAAASQDGGVWKTLFLIAVVLALGSLVLGIIFIIAKLQTAGIVFMIIALGCMALALVGAVKQGQDN